MANKKKKVTLLDILKIMFKRVKLSTLLLLVITCASTSFAWFVYSTKVNAGIQAHIESWEILFTNNDTELSQYVSFIIPNLYPGMTSYTDQINIVNLGERSADVVYEVTSVKIFGTQYIADGTTLTSAMLINRLSNEYPFHITFSLTNQQIDTNHGSSTFSLTANWPYESGNDTLDTTWGNNAYNYQQSNPTLPSVEITVKITATQTTA